MRCAFGHALLRNCRWIKWYLLQSSDQQIHTTTSSYTNCQIVARRKSSRGDACNEIGKMRPLTGITDRIKFSVEQYNLHLHWLPKTVLRLGFECWCSSFTDSFNLHHDYRLLHICCNLHCYTKCCDGGEFGPIVSLMIPRFRSIHYWSVMTQRNQQA